MKHTILITASLLAIFACGKDPGTHPGGNNDNPGDTEEPELPVDPPVDPSAVCIDTPLMIFSNGKPTVGTGKITVEDASGKVVDMIDLSDMQYVTTASDGVMLPKEKIGDTTPYNTFMDILRCGGSQKRIVHYTPIRVTDMGLEVHLHSAVLDFDKVYTFKAEAGVIQGMTEPYSLQFKTKPKPASKTQLNVNPDGSGDFCTVQGAITYSYSLGKSAAVTINIAPATYPEMLYIRDRENLTLKGTAHRATCIIAYTNCEKYEGGSGGNTTSGPTVGNPIGKSGGRGLVLVENCNNLALENLTIRNEVGQNDGQAETIYFNSGSNAHRLTIENCELWSWQDTFLTKGIVWVHNSTIAGHCDYIWGYPKACLFEDCEIRSLAKGYIVQARVQSASDKGFVFLNCTLTAGSGAADGSMYLARANDHSKEEENKKTYDNVTYINCTMSPVIANAGWLANPAPNPGSPTTTSGWKEYGSKDASGNAIDTGLRSRCGKVLTAGEAAAYSSREVVLGF